MPQSTVEAELIGMMDGHQHGEGISSLVEEMPQENVTSTLYADSRSAISLSVVPGEHGTCDSELMVFECLRSSMRAAGTR